MSESPPPTRIGAVLFGGFTLLDLFGPLQMFAMLRGRVELTLHAQEPGLVASGEGPECRATHPLAGDHPLDVLLVPGGFGTRREVENPALLSELRAQCDRASWVASVCTGSALLARCGALDGRRATSNKLAFEWVRSVGPAVTWVPRARWVEDGKFFTSSGVAAGIDMSLALIERIFGRQARIDAANQAEYEWRGDPDRDPFAAMRGPA